MHPRPATPDYWCVSLFFLVGPGPVHEIAVSAFSRSPLGRANTFSFQYLSSTPCISPSASPLSPSLLALVGGGRKDDSNLACQGKLTFLVTINLEERGVYLRKVLRNGTWYLDIKVILEEATTSIRACMSR